MLRLAALMMIALGFLTAAEAKDSTAEKAQAMIRRATEVSDVSSIGPFTLRIHAKFYGVKAGTINADYEKVIVSPQLWRASFSSPEYNSVTIYANSQVSEWSDTEEKPIRVRQFEHALAALSQSIQGNSLEYSIVQQELEAASDQKFPCIHMKDRRRLLMDCIYPDTGAFKRVQEGSWTFLYGDYMQVGKKLWPETINVDDGSKLVAVLKLQVVESATAAAPSLFTPPPGSQSYPACPEALGLPLGPKGGKILKQVPPQSPGLPPNGGIISNDATVDGILGRDGRLHNYHMSDNIPLLREALEEAIPHWEWEPFNVCGHPIEVPVGFTVWFSKNGWYRGTSEHD